MRQYYNKRLNKAICIIENLCKIRVISPLCYNEITMKTLKNKCVILGVTGSIAAYKAADIASSLAKSGCDTQVILTENGAKIIAPITFSTLTGNKCITQTFDEAVDYNVAHVALAKRADLLVIAPATANIIAKLACGMADDMLTTTALACTCPKLISPAMNTAMYENPVVQENLSRLASQGWEIIEPDSGMLACKDIGTGKFPKPQVIVDEIWRRIARTKDMAGLRVLVTAGPTCEPIDPVRYVTNHSSGKMGYALAKSAILRGAKVTLVSGPVSLSAFPGIDVVPVRTAQEMYDAVTENSDSYDIIIKAAAVADYTPRSYTDHKIKKDEDGDSFEHGIEFIRTKDILAALGDKKRDGQFLCGFAMETDNLLENGKKKLGRKNADMICANSLRTAGAGFKTDTNVLTLITEDGNESLPLLSKDDAADRIFTSILRKMNEPGKPENEKNE